MFFLYLLSATGTNYEISRNVLRYLYDWGAKSLGYACMNAQKVVMEESDYLESTARGYIFLGDPAIKLKGSVVCDASDGGEVPEIGTRLCSNYPNPFNPATVIEYQLAEGCEVELSIYDVSGRLIRRLVDGYADRGSHRVVWDGCGNDGRELSSGVYFYRLKTPYFIETKKLVLLR